MHIDVLISTSFISTQADSEAIADELNPLADPEAIADGLNPLTMSHTARIISYAATGIAKRVPQTETGGITPKISSKAAIRTSVAPVRPRTAINRGTSLDL